MRKRYFVAGMIGTVAVIAGGVSVSWAVGPSLVCRVTLCGTEGGIVTESCVPEVADPGETIATGSAGALSPGECETVLAKDPCDEIEDCVLLFATRQTPVLGPSALLIAAIGIGCAGALRLRRRSRKSAE